MENRFHITLNLEVTCPGGLAQAKVMAEVLKAFLQLALQPDDDIEIDDVEES